MIENAYWVIPGKLMAGEYPGAWGRKEAQARLHWLLEQGVSVWIDLTQEGEGDLYPYDELLVEEADKLGKCVGHIRMEIEDFCTTSQSHMQRILDKLDELLDGGQTVYLHCYGGIGRTGMTVGCFLVRHGWDGENVLRQIAEWRKHTPSGWRPSPETEEQRAFVLNWVS